MATVFKRGSIVTYYQTFLTLSQQEPSIVFEPKITIRHIDDAYNLITDINEAPMTLVAETTYYFKWNIPSDAYIGTYNVEAQAVIDGEYAESNETVQVQR